jgi:single-strand DNA-binding protein
MSSYNRVILMGNLTRDPKLSYLPSNMAVCEFGIATNRRFRDRDGNQKEEVCFVDCSAFGKSAEVINQYMTKGRSMLVEGRLKLDQWTGQDGTKRSKLRVVVDNFTFVGGREGAGSGAPGAGAPAAMGAPSESTPGPRPAPPTRAPAAEFQDSYSGDEAPPPPSDDDLPF